MRYFPARHAFILAVGLSAGGVLAAALAPRAAAAQQERTGPASRSDMEMRSMDASREALADEKRTEAIEQLKQIIPKITDPSQKADLLFQLAELWWEKQRYVYFQEMDAWDAAYNDWMEATNRGEQLPEPEADHRKSELLRQEAIALYQRILEEYPDYPRNDEVLFNLAYNMYQTDRKEEAVKLYYELTLRHPDSRFVPDAYSQLGDHFFDSNNVMDARMAYQKALATNEPRIRNYALYKLAWCDINVGEQKAAIEKFGQVVAASEAEEAQDPSKRGRIQLKKEALRDLVMPYTTLDIVDEAIAYYEAHGDDDAHKYIANLASAYFDGGKNHEAIAVYRHLIGRDPHHVDAPEYQSNIVHAYANLEERETMLSEMARLVEVYGPNGPWAVANKDDADAVRKGYEVAESTQRNLVTEYHKEARKTKYASTYRLAAEIYRRYLEKFSDSEHAYELRYYYADILWTLEEYELAAEQYMKLVEVDPNGEHTLDAAYNALLSYEKLAAIARGDIEQRELSGKQKVDEGQDKGDVERKQIVRKASKDDEAEEIPKWEQKQIEASDAYVSVIDRWREQHAEELGEKKLAALESDEIAVRYKAAFLLYNHRHYEEAAKRFEHIILKWPGDRYAVTAANLTLDSLNVKEAWAQLNKLAREFRKNEELVKRGDRETRRGEESFSATLDGLIEGSQFKVVQGIDASGDDMAAAEGYIAFVDEFPKSQYADTALFNAMLKYQEVDKLDVALGLAQRLYDGYPDSDLQPRAVEALGSYNEKMADYAAAARYYREYADRYLDEDGEWFERIVKGKKDGALDRAKKMQAEVREHLPDNLFNAGLWYEGLGEYDAAAQAYLQYVKTFEDRDDVPEVYYAVARLYEQQQRWETAAEAFQTYAKRYASQVQPRLAYRARYRAALALDEAGDRAGALRLYGDLVSGYAKLPQEDRESTMARDAAAHAAFRLLEKDFDAFQAITFDTTNQGVIANRLKQKTASLAELEKGYTGVLAYGSGDWGIAALTRIGLGYQDFARNLLDAPIPPNLDMDQQELYRAILEERAFPLEEKAIEALEKALEKSYELTVYNDWTIEAQNVLLAFKPGAYGEVRDVDYFGSEFFITADVRGELAEEPILVEPEPASVPAEPSAEQARR